MHIPSYARVRDSHIRVRPNQIPGAAVVPPTFRFRSSIRR